MLWTGTRPTTGTDGNPLVTWAQMQAQLRLDDSTDQTYVMDLIDACSEFAEQALDSSLLTREMTVTHYLPGVFNLFVDLPYKNKGLLFLPRGPVASVTSVVDVNAKTLTFSQLREGLADEIDISSDSGFTSPVTVTYQAGYGDTYAAVPADIRMAIRTHVATLWERRSSVSPFDLKAVPHSLADFYRYKRRTAPVA